jgi:hypothetical protein
VITTYNVPDRENAYSYFPNVEMKAAIDLFKPFLEKN